MFDVMVTCKWSCIGFDEMSEAAENVCRYSVACDTHAHTHTHNTGNRITLEHNNQDQVSQHSRNI